MGLGSGLGWGEKGARSGAEWHGGLWVGVRRGGRGRDGVGGCEGARRGRFGMGRELPLRRYWDGWSEVGGARGEGGVRWGWG